MPVGAWAIRTRRWAAGVLSLIVVLAILEAVARSGYVSRNLFTPVSTILRTFSDLLVTGVLPREMLSSLARIGAGLLLAIVTMIPLGTLIGVSRLFRQTLLPLIELLRPLPPTALIPVAMLFLGIGEAMKISVIGFACAFPILINTIDGIRGVHPTVVYTARSFRFTRMEMIRKVLIPAASPQIMTGIRVSLPLSLIVVILSEMVGSVNGIGRYILIQQRSFNVPEMYAGILMVALIGYAINRLFLLVDQRVIVWHRASTGNR